MPSARSATPLGRVIFADNLAVLRSLPSESVDLIYIDPPFNTGKTRLHQAISAMVDENGATTGFKGKRYRREVTSKQSYSDIFEGSADYIAFLRPRLKEARRILTKQGSIYFHSDFREVHYCKLLLDEIFGRSAFLNEIIWAYDYGAKSKRRWSPKHDNILVYVKDPKDYYFNVDEMDRIAYMAPSLVSEEKRQRGKLPTDTWWHTIVPTNSSERTGYPTQKPMELLRRIIRVSCPPGGTVLDFFAGSGTTGAVCVAEGRSFILVDDNPEALRAMAKRLSKLRGIKWVGFDPGKGEPTVTGYAKVANGRAAQPQGKQVAHPDRVSVISVCVSAYDHLPRLPGAKRDADIVKEIFTKDGVVGIFESHRVKVLMDTTTEEFGGAISEYLNGVSASGEILVFHFSGHGAITADGSFAMCLRNTALLGSDRGIVPVTAVKLKDLLSTLSMGNVGCVAIIDACFSGQVASEAHGDVTALPSSAIQDARQTPMLYAAMTACTELTAARDERDGGTFTKALRDVVRSGLKGHKRRELLTLNDVYPFVEDALIKDGHAQPVFFKHDHMKAVPLWRNAAYHSLSYKAGRYVADIVDYAYAKGAPYAFALAEIRGDNPSAYGNHTKLGYGPWGLLEDGEPKTVKGQKRTTRRLTQRGVQFARSRLSIPLEIRSTIGQAEQWEAVPGSKMVKINDLREDSEKQVTAGKAPGKKAKTLSRKG